jgi:hypothetical protein
MRSQRQVLYALDDLEMRLETFDTQPVIRAINQAKYDTLEAILDQETKPSRVMANCREALRHEMGFTAYLHVQAAMNAAAWARDDLDRL